MMDYYSTFDMPSVSIRKIYLKEYADKKGYKVTDEILLEIVHSTENYSLSGYTVFGKKIEQEKLDLLNK